MRETPTRSSSNDAGLWVLALSLALCLNLMVVAGIGLAAIHAETTRPKRDRAPVQQQPVAMIIAVMPPPATSEPTTVEPPPPTPAKNRFARTSEDQSSTAPERPSFMGERNTQATSEHTPDPTAAPLPSQLGEQRRPDETPETTANDYQDGALQPPPATTPPPTEATATPSPEASPGPNINTEVNQLPKTTPQANSQATHPQPAISPPAEVTPRPDSLQGPNPIDVPVPKPTETPSANPPKITPPQESPPSPIPPEPVSTPKPELPPSPPTPKSPPTQPQDPAFSGNQRKSAITGSISRTGHSALDVVDSPLGRYQAVIGRAVEQEWQRNCVRHRDYITPGFLTVRFYVESNGKVRTVMFDGEMQTGEIQKGFTLNSIREAAIPPMPPALRKQFSSEPLELVFRFYF